MDSVYWLVAFSLISLLTVTGHRVLLMGGWVLAVRKEILGRIRKRSDLTGVTRPPQQGRVASPESASWSQEAVPWALGLCSSLPEKDIQTDHRKPQEENGSII